MILSVEVTRVSVLARLKHKHSDLCILKRLRLDKATNIRITQSIKSSIFIYLETGRRFKNNADKSI